MQTLAHLHADAPALSLFKAVLDVDVEGMDALRSELNQTGFNGTVLAPHNDAVATFLADLDVTLEQLRDEFPRVLLQMIEHHVLPFNFTVDDLTKPGNGLGGPGNNRERIEPPRGPGHGGGRPGNGGGGGSPGNGGGGGPGNGGGVPGNGGGVPGNGGGGPGNSNQVGVLVGLTVLTEPVRQWVTNCSHRF